MAILVRCDRMMPFGRAGAKFVKAISWPDFEDAVALLRELPRKRHAKRAAQSLFENFKRSHPALQCRLLIDAKPGSDEIEHDILLTIPGAGTVVLSWRPDRGIPWAAQKADHWAANFVLSVNDRSMSIQSALIYLSARLQRRPDMMQDLVDRSLILAAVDEQPPKVEEAEIEAATDAFRAGRGLFSGAAMQHWLDDMQLTLESLQELIAQSLQMKKFRHAMVAAKVHSYFKTHRSEFDRVVVMRLDAMGRASARSVADAWRRTGSCPILDSRQKRLQAPSGKLDTLFARELPVEFTAKPVGSVIGPVASGRAFWVGQILDQRDARFDQATRGLIANLLFDTWLADQRAKATIRWHWV